MLTLAATIPCVGGAVSTGLRPRCLALVLVSLVVFAACVPVYRPLPDTDLVDAPSFHSRLAGCGEAAATVVVTADTHLDPSCEYVGVVITASNVTLDCRGARIVDADGSHTFGIEIRTAADQGLTGVRVRNCFVSGFLNDLRVQRTGFKTLAAGAEYDHPTMDIRIENSWFHDARGSGVFVDGYVTGVTLHRVEVRGAGSVGVYLEAGSKDNVIEASYVHDNGYRDTGPAGVPITFGGVQFRYVSTGREGIAVDGPRNNVIRDNWIVRNSAGGVFLYKNCGENATSEPAPWWQRRYGAEGNVIAGNVMTDEPTGVWLGSRMSENQYFMDCSDPAYVSSGVTRIYRDSAPDNTVQHNRFVNVEHGVRVEDDKNVVTANSFTGAGTDAVVIGANARTDVLHEPTRATRVTGNVSTLANPSASWWAYGEADTVFTGNETNGQPAVFTQSTPIPIDAFLFAKKIWVP